MWEKGGEGGVALARKVLEKANDTYYMLKRTDVPVIIVECGFLSNRAEADLLVTEEYQDRLAEAIAKGILEYMGK